MARQRLLSFHRHRTLPAVVANFILHWTFLLELGLWLWAGILYNRTRRL